MTEKLAGRRRATIMDVAKAAQVSRQTVSNVVNKPHRVAPDTLERVQREIDRLGFRPSLAARSLSVRRANAFGIELNTLGERKLGGLLDQFLVELTIASRLNDAHLVPFAAARADDPVPAYADLLASQLVDAFILTDTRHDDPRPAWLSDRGVPFVSFGRVWDDPSFPYWVDVDGYGGTVAAVEHLLEQGYERIGFLGWPGNSPVGEERRAGWRAATERAGHAYPELEAFAVQDIRVAAVAAAPLIKAIGRGGAMVCASDTLATGAWAVLRDEGMVPGPDFGLVGFDDSDLARSFGFTSMRQPLQAVAESVLDILERARSGKALTAEGTLYQPIVISRSSTTRSTAAPTPL
jgi:DNA-binding LacI/PurR family transcriptional regulator